MSPYVGLDLAWSTRARTGVAVADEAGALVASGTVVSDADLDAWLAEHAPDARIVAIDAPIVVANATGQRPCETLMARHFGRFHASAHTANRSRAWFDPPRAETLAQRHRWAVDPASTERPLALEVYPHAAIVGLFGLPRILPYKAKSQRPLEVRQQAMTTLLGLLRGVEPLRLADHPRWAEIEAAVAGSTRHVDLERVEDEVDAVLCAHLAWRWEHERDSLVVYGEAATGTIVAPPPPDRTVPVPGMVSPERMKHFEVRGTKPATFATERERGWRDRIRDACPDDPFPPDERVSVEMEFWLPPVTAHYDWDIDNLVKPVLDAMHGLLGTRSGRNARQSDDDRVDRLLAVKRRTEEEHLWGVVVRAEVWDGR